MPHQFPLFETFPCKSFLAKHAILTTINNLLMMKFQLYGDFCTAGWPAGGLPMGSELPRVHPLGFGRGFLGPLVDHLVDNPPFHRGLCSEEVIALQRILKLLK